jgi:osmotically-inducible protein OsmY
MKNIPRTLLTASAAVVLTCSLGFVPAYGQQADNSGQNKAQSPTADDQANSAQADRQTTANVRKAIVGDKNLSTYAHNVKIITHGGHVTLKGPVKSDQEKQQVQTDAATAVSADSIDNQLTVKE